MATTQKEEQSAAELLSYMTKPSDADAKLIEKAFEFAKHAHRNHKRMSGEPYFNHLYATAHALAELDMDAATIAAGLLHDSIEDLKEVTSETIKNEFGPK